MQLVGTDLCSSGLSSHCHSRHFLAAAFEWGLQLSWGHVHKQQQEFLFSRFLLISTLCSDV